MTYRERREAKAERLREWADKREAKAESAYRTSKATADMIPFGQPILAGHHSQRSDERRRDRMGRQMSASVEHSHKAESFKSRADNIEAAADHAIYSDDPDAVEKLAAKLAKLEAQRENAKQRNAEYWREHKAEKRTMTTYQRDRAQPFPSYYGSNLSGLISTTRKRLALLEAKS
jgi:Domain of unknown function (DUF3560)